MNSSETRQECFNQLDNSLAQYCMGDEVTHSDTILDEDSIGCEAVIDDFYKTARYLNGEIVNQGGSKKIICAEDSYTNRSVALATLKEENPSKAAIENFIREARITASLQHPNIISVHDIGFDIENNIYFSMDYIEGPTLAKILNGLKIGDPASQKTYTLNKLVTIFLNICSAVKYAHSKNIVHLDLKPNNILMGNEESPYICDWGIAEQVQNIELAKQTKDFSPCETAQALKIPIMPLETQSSILVNNQTQRGHVIGTPGYMAPEQASSRGKQRGKRTDIYALGAILYEILTYQPSLTGKSLNELVNQTLDGEIISPSDRAPANNIPAALESISIKAMSTNVKNRYSSVAELVSDIRLFLSCGPNEKRNADLFQKIREVVNSKRKQQLSNQTSTNKG